MRVLVVEDDRSIGAFIREALEGERYDVDLARDGGYGLDQALSAAHDVILLDVVLPTRSGIEILRQVRARGIQTPVLILSARDSVQDKVTALEMGADDYLAKPFDLRELMARIKALLRRHERIDLAPTLQVADLVLDRNTHDVQRTGQPIELTPREFALLEYLMRRSNRVLSRALIQEQVWGSHHDTSTNVVDVYIRHLRRKIDHGHERPLIRTVRGVGYQIRA